MIPWLGEILLPLFGPFRLFGSGVFLIGLGAGGAVLMGDAGSRPIGFLLGTLVLATRNPVLILVVAGVVLAIGTPLLLLLVLKIR